MYYYIALYRFLFYSDLIFSCDSINHLINLKCTIYCIFLSVKINHVLIISIATLVETVTKTNFEREFCNSKYYLKPIKTISAKCAEINFSIKKRLISMMSVM